MDWEQRFCFNRACQVGSWMVLRGSANAELWWVTQQHDQRPYVVAGTVPVCMCCGTDLLTIVDLEGGIGGLHPDEQGRVFDFLRQL